MVTSWSALRPEEAGMGCEERAKGSAPSGLGQSLGQRASSASLSWR